MAGFLHEGDCFHFDGDLVGACRGRCTVWEQCVEKNPEQTCDDARAAKATKNNDEDGIYEGETGFSMGVVAGIIAGVVACCFFCICITRNRSTYENPNKPNVDETNQVHFEEYDWKYWDSVLPEENKGDGKFKHLIVSRNGKVIGVKPGFRRDGSRLPTGITESEERSSNMMMNSRSSIKQPCMIDDVRNSDLSNVMNDPHG